MALRNAASFAARSQLSVAGAVAALNSTVLAGTLLTTTFLTVGSARVAAQDIELSNIDNGTGGFVINGQAASDYSGFSVASAGDVNGDGLADVIVGARASDPASGTDAGRSYLVFGKSSGLHVDLSAVDDGTGGFVINGQAGDDRSGISVSSAGDVNGDGLADLLVGADYSDPTTGGGGDNRAGRGYVVFGKTDTNDVNLLDIDNNTGGFVINGQAGFDFSARSVSSAGDVNGDGLADLAIGASRSDPAAGSNAGRSYVVFGKTDTNDVNLSAVDGTSPTNGVGGFVINGQAPNDRSGVSVSSAGDVNGDGLGDVIVGAYYSDPPVVPPGGNPGRSYVVFGKTDTADVNLSAVDGTSSSNGVGGFVINGHKANDRSGSSVSSAGDVNGDGLADVIVGAPYYGSGDSRFGASYVVFGKTDTADVNLSAIVGTAGVGVGGFYMEAAASQDYSGRSVSAAGDLNGDGLADVIVGTPSGDPASGVGAGRSYVVLGKTDTNKVVLPLVDAGTGGFVINGQMASDGSGRVSAAGDVNGDGLADVIVGAPGSDPASGTNAGRSYVVFSPLTPASTAQYRAQVAAGDPNRQGIGVHRFGDDGTVFPDSRAWVDFDAGSGPGLASSSEVIATITRNDSGLAGLDPVLTANVQWELSTNRTGWSTCRVTLRYTDAEIAGQTEGSLQLVSAPTAAGPFVPVAGFSLDSTRNEASGDVASLPQVFALIEVDTTSPVATITRLMPTDTADQFVAWSVDFDEPVVGVVDPSEVVPTGSLAGAVIVKLIEGASPPFIVRLGSQGETLDGSLGFDLAAGAVTDVASNPVALSSAPAYTIDEPDGSGGLAGDVDKNGVVNVADVTLLSNFIVNGAPPLP